MVQSGDFLRPQSSAPPLEIQGFTVAGFLRPRYRTVLRYHRRRPHLLRLSGNLSLLSCFAISLCVAACMYKWVDEICDSASVNEEVNHKWSAKDRLSLAKVKAILEQRGVFAEHSMDRDELDALLTVTGEVTSEELIAADKLREKFKDFKASQCPDALLHQKVVSSCWDPYTDSDSTDVESIVFDSESAFVERVDDNKDSVWLLAVVANGVNGAKGPGVETAHTDSVITSEVWGHLVHTYSPFGFKLGLIDCHRLRSLCHDRGFVAADLVLAVPKGGDRIKDSLQFRPYPRQSVHTDASKSAFPTSQVVRHIRRWLSSVLSERLHRISSVDDILPLTFQLVGSENQPKILRSGWMSWLRRRPQPVQVIWVKNMSSVKHPLKMSKVWEDHLYPPMVLSALSVPYTGRVRFSVLTISTDSPDPKPALKSTRMRSRQRHSIEPIIELLDAFGCSKSASFHILTPEGHCIPFGSKRGEFLSYSNLELQLRFLYPSADDFLLLLAILVNLLVILNSAVEAGKWLACLARYSMGVSSPLPSTQATGRLRMAQSIVRLARRGWTSHIVPQVREEQLEYLDESTAPTPSVQRTVLWKRLIACVQNSFMDFISSNFLLLIAILPLINLLSLPQAAFVVNSSLCLLRRLVTSSLLIPLRLSIAAGHMTLPRLALLTVIFCTFLSGFVAHVYLIVWSGSAEASGVRGHRRSASVRLLHRIRETSPHEFLNELSRLLLAASDVEGQTEPTSSSASSSATTDADLAITGDRRNVRSRLLSNTRVHRGEGLDQTRLLNQLTRLHRLLNSEDSVVHSPIGPPVTPELVDTDDAGRTGFMPLAAPAHIYTWQCSKLSRPSVTTDETSLPPTNLPNVGLCKADSVLRSELNNPFQESTSEENARLLFGLDAEYEAEDEADEHENTAHQHSFVYRRPRFRRPRLPLRPDRQSHSSTASESSEVDRVADEAEDPNVTPANLCTNWPPWVIPCESCVVCWRKFRLHVRLGALPCGHGFHEACIRRWLDTGALDCPVCRWPAHAPHLRQQRQMLGQLLTAVHTSLNAARQRNSIESS
ncbi:E3 ubiquitin-protein ligase RNF103 [Clonorchis sinensis]|uniref:E3 ubiquitin-protein ligase RNF103 n=2 Tax=Clonorchis sinensis TaxID=79923 RepID=H2KU07_CLOSI|nr:E3 ubiquitin-protein ligase RNF103 [Clonorchis sinensis]